MSHHKNRVSNLIVDVVWSFQKFFPGNEMWATFSAKDQVCDTQVAWSREFLFYFYVQLTKYVCIFKHQVKMALSLKLPSFCVGYCRKRHLYAQFLTIENAYRISTRGPRRSCFASKALELCRDVNNEKRTHRLETQKFKNLAGNSAKKDSKHH